MGTSHHRDTHPCLLTGSYDAIEQLSKEATSTVACRLFDGVGCTGTKEHPTPGTYECDFANDTKKLLRNPHYVSNLSSQATGYGIENLVNEAKQYIDNIILSHERHIPRNMVINLQGFSRGADACVRVANCLNKIPHYSNIKINLFLIDPVPGPIRIDEHDSYTIPANVDECHVIYMLNEHKPFFSPQSYVYESTKTRVFMNTLAGAHGAGIALSADNETHSSYYLVSDSLLKFNISKGLLPEKAMIEEDYERQGEVFHKVDLSRRHAEYRLMNMTGCGFSIDYGWVSYWWIKSLFPNEDGFVLKDNKWYFVDHTLKTVKEISVSSDDDSQLKDIFNSNVLSDCISRSNSNLDIGPVNRIASEGEKEFIRTVTGHGLRAILSDQKRFEYFCESMAVFQRLERRRVVQQFYLHRDIFERRSDYIRDSDLFLDEEHRELFKRLHPDIFNWFFEGNSNCYTKYKVHNSLRKLIPKEFANEIARYFNFQLTMNDSDFPEPQGKLRNNRIIFGEHLVSDELSYFRYSLQSIVSRYYKVAGRNDAQQTELALKIKTALKESDAAIDDELSTKKLTDVIIEITKSNSNGFIKDEVSFIAPSLELYIASIDDMFKSLGECELSENQLSIINDNKLLIAQIKSSIADDMQKRIKIRNVILYMHSQLIMIDHTSTSRISSLSRKISQELNNENEQPYNLSEGLKILSRSGYAESNLVDKTISELSSFISWRNFLNYFPIDFGWYNLEHVDIAKNLLDELTKLKTEGFGNNLLAIQKYLDGSLANLSLPKTERSQKLKYEDNALKRILAQAMNGVRVNISPFYVNPMPTEKRMFYMEDYDYDYGVSDLFPRS